MPPKNDPKAAAAAAEEDEVKAAEEAALRQTSLIASTFANVELESTKATLAQYVTLYNTSRDEAARLAQELQERDRDAMTVVQFLRNDLDQRQDQIKELKKKAEEDIRQLTETKEAEKAELRDEIAERDGKISELTEKISVLEANLAALEAFRRERENMHVELARLHEEHQESVAKYEAELSKQRFLSLEEKVRLKAEERAMAERFDTEVNERAMKLLDTKTKEINAENFMLLKDKAMLERELSRANEACAKFNAKAADQRRETELAQLADAEHVRRSVAKQREVKELRQRVQELEANLGKTVRDDEQRLIEVQRAHARQCEALTKERDEALKTAELVQRDFLKMRQLSRTVVKQRTELETFFMEALDYVRAEIERERRPAGITGGSKSNVLRITAGPSAAGPLPDLVGTQTSKRGAAARAARQAERSGSTTATSQALQQQAIASQQGHEFFANREHFEAVPGASRSVRSGSVSVSEQAPSRVDEQRPGSLPPIGGSRTGSKTPNATADAAATAEHNASAHEDPHATLPVGKVDISELSWSDKERVLRILFAKLNSVSHQRRAPAAPSSSVKKAARPPAIEGPNDSVFMTQQ